MSDKLSKEAFEEVVKGFRRVGTHYPPSHNVTEKLIANRCYELAAEYTKQEILAMLKWLLTPNDDYTISSGEGCFYFNGVEKSFPEMYELFQKSNAI